MASGPSLPSDLVAGRKTQSLETDGTVMPSAWFTPFRASSARSVVEISGVPEPRAELPGPPRFHCTITSASYPPAPADVQRQNSQAVRRSADTTVRWPSEPDAGVTPGGTGIGLPSYATSSP